MAMYLDEYKYNAHMFNPKGELTESLEFIRFKQKKHTRDFILAEILNSTRHLKANNAVDL